jgi:hypothetical protein
VSKILYKKDNLKPYIIQVMAMDLRPWKNIQDYLKDRGFKISRQYYTKLKNEINESRFDRLALIAKSQFVDQHLERIAVLETIQSELWSLYRNEPNNFKKSEILEKIANIQSYISSYYDSSQYIMQKSIQEEKQHVSQK